MKKIVLIFSLLAVLPVFGTSFDELIYTPVDDGPFAGTLSFSETTAQKYEENWVYAYSFSLEEDVVFNAFIDYYSAHGSIILLDENKIQIDSARSIFRILKSGNYFILISDGGKNEEGLVVNSQIKTYHIEPVTLDYNGEILSKSGKYYLKFTLPSEHIITINNESNTDVFVLYDENFEILTDEINVRSICGLYPAGTYYLQINTYSSLSLSIQVLDVDKLELLTLPVQDRIFTFSEADGAISFGGHNTLAYKFTLSEKSALSINGQEPDMFPHYTYCPYCQLYDAKDKTLFAIQCTMSITLGAGTYYLLLDERMYRDSNQEMKFNIDISKLDFEKINIPFEEELTFHPDNMQPYHEDYAFLYQFTLEEAKDLIFYSEDASVYFYLYDTDMNNIIASRHIEHSFSAGTYYVVIDGYFPEAHPTIPVYIDNYTSGLISYTEVDYSNNLVPDKEIWGKLHIKDDVSVKTRATGRGGKGKGYNLAVKKGNEYQITYQVYGNDVSNAVMSSELMPCVVLLKNGELTGDIFKDQLIEREASGNASASVTVHYAATDTENVRMLLYSSFSLPEIMYSVTVKEVEIITLQELLADPDIPVIENKGQEISYVGRGRLGMGNSAAVAGKNGVLGENNYKYYASAYKIHLSENEVINVKQTNNWYGTLYIYNAAGTRMTSISTGNQGTFKAPAAGEYFLVTTIHNSSLYMEGNLKLSENYMLEVWNTPGSPAAASMITFWELFNRTVDIPYSDNLFYVDKGQFGHGTSLLVSDMHSDIRGVGDKCYATIYKINLPEGTRVSIEQNIKNSGYLYVYNDNERKMAFNEGAGPITFTASYTGNYYIINTTEGLQVHDYTMTIRRLDKKPEIVAISADKKTVRIGENATEEEIRKSLFSLKLTATLANGQKVNINNNPMYWALNEDNTMAVCVLSENNMPNFTLANTVSVKVNITDKPETGVDEIDTNSVIVYVSNKTLYVKCAIPYQLMVFNIRGQLVCNEYVDVSNKAVCLPQGVYLVRINDLVVKAFVP